MAFWTNNKKNAISIFLRKSFGVKAKNINVYEHAFTHSSSVKNSLDSNERLEFLGDAILDSIVAEYLYDKYPKKDEGFLTRSKSKIVSRKSLNSLGSALNLASLIKQQKSLHKNSIEGNAFEALIGALYIDVGFKKTKEIVITLIEKHFSLAELEKDEIDEKSRLYQWCQKEKVSLETRFVRVENESGFSYSATLFIGAKMIGKGQGLSKKRAEMDAARSAFDSGILDTINVKK